MALAARSSTAGEEARGMPQLVASSSAFVRHYRVVTSRNLHPLRSAKYGFILAIVSPVALVLAPLIYRLRLAGLSALLLIPVALVFALIAVVLSVVGIVAMRRRRSPQGMGRAIAGLVMALAVLMFPVVVVVNARGSPPIHDVTTDTVTPPEFVAVLPIRAQTGALNPVEYGGPRVAALQQQSFPDIKPLRRDLIPQAAFDRALAAVRAMNWEVVAADPSAGRIEATDTTALFGFKDDVVVRVRADGNGSRIDVRSLSRVGGGDLGTNAKRVRAYLRRLAEAQAGERFD
jgi:uncharacterized protein (DUF1499 family)